LCCSDYTYFLNVTVAGVYNQTYPGTGQAFKVGSSAGHPGASDLHSMAIHPIASKAVLQVESAENKQQLC
jgi:hypothetical protein